jgi:glucose dehydrogenase
MEYAGGAGGGRGGPPQTPPGVVAGLGPQVSGLPIVKPPYGRITAFNLKTGELTWMVANGEGPRHHPLLKELGLPPLGIPNRPAPLLTKTPSSSVRAAMR